MSALAVAITPPVPTPPSLIPAPSPAVLNELTRVQIFLGTLPQVPLATEHILHGGMYARTIRREPGSITVGSLINRATVLIVNGSCSILIDDRRVDLEGYNVLAGLPGRKSLSVTRGPVEMTMICPTSAKTVEEAENEIFAEADHLVSRRDNNKNKVTITGQ
jgi:hypothetical protein